MSAPDDIAILRIELEDIEPLIWRRVAVRSSINLKVLHSVIQAAMVWLDCHLWKFSADEEEYGVLLPDDPDWNERIKDVATITLLTLLSGGTRDFSYVYDMGDNWQHRIICRKTEGLRTWSALSATPWRREAMPTRRLQRHSGLLRVLGEYPQQAD